MESLPVIAKAKGVVLIAVVVACVLGVLSVPAMALEAKTAAANRCSCPIGMVVVLDITSSTTQLALDRGKREVETILESLRGGTCVEVLGVTEDGLSMVEELLDRQCVAVPRYRWQHPNTKPVVSRWRTRNLNLKANRGSSDVVGTIWQGAKRLSRAEYTTRVLVSIGDQRNNVRIDLDRVEQIDASRALAQIRRDSLLPQLQGARVWFIGVDTSSKRDGRFFASQELFWNDFVKAGGGEVAAFSPEFGWAPAVAKAVAVH